MIKANRELALQNIEKEKRAAELLLANLELAYQNEEKEKRAAELIIANQELLYQNEEKEKRAEELIVANAELKKERRQRGIITDRLSFHLENTPFGFIEYNVQMEIKSWSRQAELIFGWTEKDLKVLKKSGFQFVHADDQQLVAKLINDMTSGKVISNKGQYRSYTKSGKVIWCESFNSALRDDKGQVVTIMSLVQDVTESKEQEEMSRRRLELLVEERTCELNEALQKEKELVELKSRFISIASHEFRTPLSTISFAAESIRTYFHKLSATQISKKLIKIEDQASHMVNLLEDVLTIGRSEAGKIKVKRISLDLQEFIESLIEETRSTVLEKREINFSFLCNDRMISTDDTLLRNILNNLITNALKFSDSDKPVGIVVSNTVGHIQIVVTDQGIGIHNDELTEIFESFSRGSNASTIPGTGLGLSILKKAVDLMGGTVSVVSQPGKGSEFTVTMPLQ
ncbi:MAG: PAS domain-containing sensor histidine kinase [Bacteroidota bacterium]